MPHTSPRPRKAVVSSITAVEEEDDDGEQQRLYPPAAEPVKMTSLDDIIPGPPLTAVERDSAPVAATISSSTGRLSALMSRITRPRSVTGSVMDASNSTSTPLGATGNGITTDGDELQLSSTDHNWSGYGIRASRRDLEMDPKEFAAGCNLLQAAAKGNLTEVQAMLDTGKTHVNFRDYDRRTALHVAASEGHLPTCQYLVLNKGARINRSDRWGGSPLDDAHRHRHVDVIAFLRANGGTTGSGNRLTNLITAASQGDVDEVRILLQAAHLDNKTQSSSNNNSPGNSNNSKQQKSGLDINRGDYDKRTPLHLAAGEGHAEVVKILLDAGADANVEDRWMRRPLDDAMSGGHKECAEILKSHGAIQGVRKLGSSDSLDQSGKRLIDNLKVDFNEIEMIDRIGSGAFGEIYKCRWRGTLVAAKIIKSAKIRRDWVNKRALEAIKQGKDVDDAVKEMDEAEMEQDEKELAIADFRQEISVLKSLRHPHIVLLLAYSTTENYECLLSELMKCSLLDVFKSHIVQGTRMPRRTQIAYATQLAMGMNYLHTCKPPVIHRDLKPANLLLDHSGSLKVSDFGLAKLRPDITTMESQQYVMTGETGSYRFMSPEVFRHENYNETVDVYSFAMILFYLLVGRPPWPNLSGLQAVRQAANEGDRPSIPRDLDVRLQNLLKECWHENPKCRPPFSAVIDILSRYNHDVFNVSTVSVVSVDQPQVGTCSCAIL